MLEPEKIANKIRASTLHPKMSAASSEFSEDTWKKLESAIKYIYQKQQGALSFETLYRGAYNLVNQRHGKSLYKRVKAMMKAECDGIADSILSANDNQFLKAIISRWDDYKLSTERIRDILMYLDRKYLNTDGTVPIFDSGVKKFRKNVLYKEGIMQRITRIILGAVAREREGENIDRETLKSITDILIMAGVNNPDERFVYKQLLEKPLLSSSGEYYNRKGEKLNLEHSAPSILQISDGAVEEEKERVSLCFDSGTSELLEDVVENNLYGKYMRSIMKMDSGFADMLRENRYSDLNRMFRLFRRRAGGLGLLSEFFLEEMRKRGNAVMSDSNSANSTALVKELIEMYDTYMKIHKQSFESLNVLGNDVNTVFTELTNGCRNISQYISLSIDELIHAGNKMEEKALETQMRGIMSIFKYVEDKDVFEKFYRNHLAKRLLLRTSSNEELERYVIELLRNEYGCSFTNKFEGMIQDFRVSRETNTSFKDFLKNVGMDIPFDLQVTVLTSGTWPTQSFSTCMQPAFIQKHTGTFEKFYLGQHSGRRLQFQNSMGNAVLKATFKGKNKHELMVSSMQMAILLLFNEKEVYTFNEILSSTGIPQKHLERHLLLMTMKSKILLREKPVKDPRTIGLEEKVKLNKAFTAKRYRIKLGSQTVIKDSTGTESSEIRKRVDEERKISIEGSIIRVMKTKTKLDFQNIIVEVTKLLSTRFSPDPRMIKGRIEDLINRDYLERSPDNRNMLLYKA